LQCAIAAMASSSLLFNTCLFRANSCSNSASELPSKRLSGHRARMRRTISASWADGSAPSARDEGPKKRDVRITLRMPEDLAKLVQEAADADRRSKSDWIVLQLEAIFAKRAQRKAEK
jgi:hypothetical protein